MKRHRINCEGGNGAAVWFGSALHPDDIICWTRDLFEMNLIVFRIRIALWTKDIKATVVVPIDFGSNAILIMIVTKWHHRIYNNRIYMGPFAGDNCVWRKTWKSIRCSVYAVSIFHFVNYLLHSRLPSHLTCSKLKSNRLSCHIVLPTATPKMSLIFCIFFNDLAASCKYYFGSILNGAVGRACALRNRKHVNSNFQTAFDKYFKWTSRLCSYVACSK